MKRLIKANEENYGEYVASKWDDFIEKLKEKVKQIGNEFNKLGSKYDIQIPNTLINKMVNYSKEDIKKINFEDVYDVGDFCQRDSKNGINLFGEYEYVCDLKESWDIDIDESFELIIYDNVYFIPSSIEFDLDDEIIYTDSGIEDKELFDSLPDEYQKKIINFINEYNQLARRMRQEYSNLIADCFG